MMPQAEQFPFVSRNPALGPTSFLPFLPITLALRKRTLQMAALIDTAATVNVLPYDIGHQLGAIWDQQTVPIQLTGNLAVEEAWGLLLSATVGKYPPVQLAFAWTKSNAIPVLLGQVNFLMEFDVCIFRSRLAFEVKTK
jgi:hypothetical protein